MADYTTLANIKMRLPITSVNASDDSVLSLLITRASTIIDGYTDNHFAKITGTRRFDVPLRNPRRLLLDDWLLTCTSVTNGTGLVIPPTEYTLEDYNNPPYYGIVIKRVSNYFFQPDSNLNDRKAIAIVGDWGYYSICPPDITEVCERLVVWMYHNKSGMTSANGKVINQVEDVSDILDQYKKTVLSVGSGGWA